MRKFPPRTSPFARFRVDLSHAECVETQWGIGRCKPIITTQKLTWYCCTRHCYYLFSEEVSLLYHSLCLYSSKQSFFYKKYSLRFSVELFQADNHLFYFSSAESIWRTDLDFMIVHRDRLVLLSFMTSTSNTTAHPLPKALSTVLAPTEPTIFEDRPSALPFTNDIVKTLRDYIGHEAHDVHLHHQQIGEQFSPVFP